MPVVEETDIIQAIRDFIKNCYLLDQEGKIGVDYLLEEPVNYSIEPVPTTTILSEDITGATVRQYIFQFSSREAWGSDELENMKNSGFYENFVEWLEVQTVMGILPTLSGGKTATKIYAAGVGFIESTTADTARYVIQCGLIYEQEAMG